MSKTDLILNLVGTGQDICIPNGLVCPLTMDIVFPVINPVVCVIFSRNLFNYFANVNSFQ